MRRNSTSTKGYTKVCNNKRVAETKRVAHSWIGQCMYYHNMIMLINNSEVILVNCRCTCGDHVLYMEVGTIMWQSCDNHVTSCWTMGHGKGSSSSKRIRFLSSKNTKKGRIDIAKTLNPKGVRDFRAKAQLELHLKVACESLHHLCYWCKANVTRSYEWRRADCL